MCPCCTCVLGWPLGTKGDVLLINIVVVIVVSVVVAVVLCLLFLLVPFLA